MSNLFRRRSLEIPDPQKCKSLRTVIDAVSILLDKKGEELFIMGRGDQGPFSLAAELRGMDNFLIDIATGEDYTNTTKILQKVLAVVTSLLKMGV